MTAAPAARPHRVFGVETEYGITAARTDGAAPTRTGAQEPLREGSASAVADPDAATGYGAAAFDAEDASWRLFTPILGRYRSSNSYLTNGARLYLDVGSHPEYASAECSDPRELLVNDRAGEELLAELTTRANAKLTEEGEPARIHLFKNNVDSAGNSFGCHENYLVHRTREYRALSETLVGFLVSRQILVGAGHVRRAPDGSLGWSYSVRSDLVWDAMSSATTRSRPMINTRDEPHADADKYRRLHVIVGDSNVAQATTLLKVAMTALVLDLIEQGGRLADLQVAEFTRAVRDVAHDITGNARIELAQGGYRTPLELQTEILGRVLDHLDRQGTRAELTEGFRLGLDLWERGLNALREGDLDPVSGELDWVAKQRLVERYRARSGAALDDPRVTRLLLAYHDVTSANPLARSMEKRGLLREIVTAQEAREAMTTPPATTRAVLRGRVLEAAQRHHRDVSVDWVHVRVEDARTPAVMLADPFATQDARIDALVAELEEPLEGHPGDLGGGGFAKAGGGQGARW